MNKFFKKLLGIDKIEEQTLEANRKLEEATLAASASIKSAEDAKEEERLAKLGPKALATEKKEPWVTVSETRVNKDNVRNGFFELDWNEYFVLQLKNAGYRGDTDEEIVGNWFSELCKNVGNENGIDMNRRSAGYINVNNLGNGKSEIY